MQYFVKLIVNESIMIKVETSSKDTGQYLQLWRNLQRYAIQKGHGSFYSQLNKVINDYGGKLAYDENIIFDDEEKASFFVLKFS